MVFKRVGVVSVSSVVYARACVACVRASSFNLLSSMSILASCCPLPLIEKLVLNTIFRTLVLDSLSAVQLPYVWKSRSSYILLRQVCACVKQVIWVSLGCYWH